jgi:ribokinase
MTRDLIGIGALNVDLVYEIDDLEILAKTGLPVEAGAECALSNEQFHVLQEVLAGNARERVQSGGGSAANTVVALARMGFVTGFAGRIGQNGFGALILEQMNEVDVSYVHRRGATGICVAVLDRRRDRALYVVPNANSEFRAGDVDADYLSRCRWLHLSSFVGDAPLQAQKALVNMLPRTVRVSLDPGELYARRGIAAIEPLLARCDVVLLTDRELRLLTDTADTRVGCEGIASYGPDMVVCKRGAQGSYVLVDDGGVDCRPAVQEEVVDNTGAGDVYNAGFLAGLLLGKSPDVCAEFAHRLAVKSLGGYGRVCYPDAEDRNVLEER